MGSFTIAARENWKVRLLPLLSLPQLRVSPVSLAEKARPSMKLDAVPLTPVRYLASNVH